MKETDFKSKSKLDEIGVTDDTLTGRGSLREAKAIVEVEQRNKQGQRLFVVDKLNK